MLHRHMFHLKNLLMFVVYHHTVHNLQILDVTVKMLHILNTM